jgi:hypothetical protein
MFRLKLDKNRKFLLLVGAIILLLGCVYRFYPFFQNLLFPKLEIELKRGQIVKYQKLLDAESGLETTTKNLINELNKAEEGLFTGKTPTLTAAQIQDILQKITAKSGVVIQRLQVLEPERLKKDAYLRIPVEFYMNATTSQLKEVLYNIGVFQKYLKVRQLNIQFAGRKDGDPVRCQITVAGYMKGVEG